MSWKEEVKKEENPRKGTWPFGTPSQQKKEFGEVMFDEFGRDADERGEGETHTHKVSAHIMKKKELLEYIEEIEDKITYVKRSLEKTLQYHPLLTRRFEHIKQISEDAIEVIKE